jgi:hypothetical protein
MCANQGPPNEGPDPEAPPGTGRAARSGPRFVPLLFLLLAGYETLAAPNAIIQS